jgi:hypothetical protein
MKKQTGSGAITDILSKLVQMLGKSYLKKSYAQHKKGGARLKKAGCRVKRRKKPCCK